MSGPTIRVVVVVGARVVVVVDGAAAWLAGAGEEDDFDGCAGALGGLDVLGGAVLVVVAGAVDPFFMKTTVTKMRPSLDVPVPMPT